MPNANANANAEFDTAAHPRRAAALPPAAQLRSLLHSLAHGLLERDTAVHLALLAALAGEHTLLIGPPGTAKSALARRLHQAFDGARYFERLLTRFSTPEELFGPLSLKALEHDRYERLVDGFLPTAGIAFLDEVFKANSAILNALLTLLNEREFDNGTQRQPVPLVAVVAASNEVPADEALQAFYDRFLVRVPVAPVADDNFAALLTLADTAAPTPPQPVTAAQRDALAQASAGVALGPDFLSACSALRQWLQQHGAPLSDRRWRQLVGLARTAAASEGRAHTDAMDLWLAPFVASAQPSDVPALQAWFMRDALQLPPPAAPWLQRAVQAFEQQLQIEQQTNDNSDSGLDDSAGKLALARAISRPSSDDAPTPTGDDGLLRIHSERLHESQRHRWGRLHIEARVAQVLQIEEQVQDALLQAQAVRVHLQGQLHARLWMPAPLQAALLAGPDATLALLQDFAARLAAARAGFAALPCDAVAADAMASAQPVVQPVQWDHA